MGVRHHQSQGVSDPSAGGLAWTLGLATLVFAVLALSTAHFSQLMGTRPFALAHALHAILAFVFVVLASVGLYHAILLYQGKPRPLRELQFITNAIAAFSLFTIMFGNWLYVGYRDKNPDSPKSFFLANTPDIHNVFFDFKEHTALFTFPLSLVAAFILWRYKDAVLEKGWLRNAVAIFIILTFVYFVIAFGFGAAITKLRGV